MTFIKILGISIAVQTRLLKQWSKKTSRTVCSFRVTPASSPANTASITHLKKNGKWLGSFMNTWHTPCKRKYCRKQFVWITVVKVVNELLNLKLLNSNKNWIFFIFFLPPKLARFLWTSHWQYNKWTWCRHCWTPRECSLPTGSSQGTGWMMKKYYEIMSIYLCLFSLRNGNRNRRKWNIQPELKQHDFSDGKSKNIRREKNKQNKYVQNVFTEFKNVFWLKVTSFTYFDLRISLS